MANILDEKGYLQRIAEALESERSGGEGSGGGDSGGGSSGGMVIGLSLDGERLTMDKTFTEIMTALENGAYVVAKWRAEEEASLTVNFYRVVKYYIYEEGSVYSVSVDFGENEAEFFTTSVDGYPSANDGGSD